MVQLSITGPWPSKNKWVSSPTHLAAPSFWKDGKGLRALWYHLGRNVSSHENKERRKILEEWFTQLIHEYDSKLGDIWEICQWGLAAALGYGPSALALFWLQELKFPGSHRDKPNLKPQRDRKMLYSYVTQFYKIQRTPLQENINLILKKLPGDT